MSPLGPAYAALRPDAYGVVRLRGRAGVSAISSIAPLRAVEPSPDARTYAEALSTAASFAADTRRAAWTAAETMVAFPRSRPAGAGLAALLAEAGPDDADAAAGGDGPDDGGGTVPRNVTPGGAIPFVGGPRGVVAGPSAAQFAAAARSYRLAGAPSF